MRIVRRAATFASLLLVSAGLLVPTSSATPLHPQAVGATSTFVALAPSRVLDTRVGIGGFKGRVVSGGALDVAIQGQGGVPNDAASVALNVTVVAPTSGGFLTLYPTGGVRPEASNVNFGANANVPNLVLARVGAGGKVTVYNFGGDVDILFDVVGFFRNGTTDGAFYPFVPFRFFDSRSSTWSNGTVHPIFPGGSLIKSYSATLPPHVSAVLLNVTVTNPTANGYISVFPAGQDPPNTSSLNFSAGQTVANAVIVKLGPSSNGLRGFTIYNPTGSTDVIVDELGYFDDGTRLGSPFNLPTSFTPLDQPVRAFDTRPGLSPFVAKEIRSVNLGGFGGAALGAAASAMNVTVTNSTSTSYVTVWPSGFSQSPSSMLNWTSGKSVANFGVLALGSTGPTTQGLSIYNDLGTADVIVDVTGYFYRIP